MLQRKWVCGAFIDGQKGVKRDATRDESMRTMEERGSLYSNEILTKLST